MNLLVPEVGSRVVGLGGHSRSSLHAYLFRCITSTLKWTKQTDLRKPVFCDDLITAVPEPFIQRHIEIAKTHFDASQRLSLSAIIEFQEQLPGQTECRERDNATGFPGKTDQAAKTKTFAMSKRI
jgi:hypothetical protein